MSDMFNLHNELYKEFCEWSPQHAAEVTSYKPWGRRSIVVWLKNGMAFKAKRCAPGKFIMQLLSEDDIKKKFESNNK